MIKNLLLLSAVMAGANLEIMAASLPWLPRERQIRLITELVMANENRTMRSLLVFYR